MQQILLNLRPKSNGPCARADLTNTVPELSLGLPGARPRLQDGSKRREESGALSRNQQFSLQCSISPLKASRKLFNEKGLGRVSICSWLESLAKSEAHKPLLYFFFLVCK